MDAARSDLLQDEIDALIDEWVHIMNMADEIFRMLSVPKWQCRRLAGWDFDGSMNHLMAWVPTLG